MRRGSHFGERHPFIHSSNLYYAPGPVLSAGYAAVNKLPGEVRQQFSLCLDRGPGQGLHRTNQAAGTEGPGDGERIRSSWGSRSQVGKPFLSMRNTEKPMVLEDSFSMLTQELNYSETPNGLRWKFTKSV